MSDDKQPEQAKPKGKPKSVRGVIMVDGVWSSLGEHRKGDKVELPEEDAKILEDRDMFTRFD